MNCPPMCSTLMVADDCADLPRCSQQITNPSVAFLRSHTPNRRWPNHQPVIVGLIKESLVSPREIAPGPQFASGVRVDRDALAALAVFSFHCSTPS